MHATYILKSTHAHNHKRLVLNSYHCFGRLFALQELWIDYDWARRCHLLCSVCRQWCDRPSRVNLVDPDIQSIQLTAGEQFHPCLSQFKHWLSGSLIHLTKWSESSTKQKKGYLMSAIISQFLVSGSGKNIILRIWRDKSFQFGAHMLV